MQDSLGAVLVYRDVDIPVTPVHSRKATTKGQKTINPTSPWRWPAS